jgi:branched-chain amino acid transport system substrate-binding protein
MSEDRRNFMKYAVTAIVCGVVAGVGGYFGGVASIPPAAEKTVTKTTGVGETVTKTVTKTVTSAPTTAAPSFAGKEEIVIGASLALTGIYSVPATKYHAVFNWWADKVNERGGFSGVPIRLIMYDDESEPSKAVSNYEKLITVDNVDLLIGCYPTAVIIPTLGVVQKYGRVMFAPLTCPSAQVAEAGAGVAFWCGGSPAGDWWVKSLMQWLASMPEADRPKTAAVITSTSAWNVAMGEGAKNFAPDADLEIVYGPETFEETTTDFTPLLTKIKAAGAEVLISAPTAFAAASLITRTMREIDYNPKVYWDCIAATMPGWVSELGPVGNDVVIPALWMPNLKGAGYKGVDELVNAINSREIPIADDEWLTSLHVGLAYTTAQILEDTVVGTGSLEDDVLKQYLMTHKFDTVQGETFFDEKGVPNYRCILAQVQNGALQIIYPPEVATAKPVYPKTPW